MQTYLIYTIQDLIIAGILAGFALAYARTAWGVRGMRAIAAAIVVGLVAGAAMAFMKQTTNKIDTGTWNMAIFQIAAVSAVVFLLSLIGPIAKSKPGKIIGVAALALFVALRIFYKVPDVYLYPTIFNVTNILSSDFFLRLIGYLGGIATVVLASTAIVKFTKSLPRKPVGIALGATVVIVAVVQMMTCLQTMLARRIIPSNHDLFLVVKWFANNSALFIFVVMAIAAVLAIAVIVRSLRDIEPYANPAEHRKIKAKWRNRRRWAICFLVCLVIATLTITVIKDYNSRGPEVSPSEECEVRDGAVYVSLDQVGDEHLHRFTYTTEAGVELDNGKTTQGGVGVRFIVIKKPGSNAYGVGLDACEICGQTGYYERDGQVVCILCDVVMNKNTIGFKGGCNPIPVEYRVEDGYIILSTDVLSSYEKTFK